MGINLTNSYLGEGFAKFLEQQRQLQKTLQGYGQRFEQSYTKMINDVRGPIQELAKQQEQLENIASRTVTQAAQYKTLVDKTLDGPVKQIIKHQNHLQSLIQRPLFDVEKMRQHLNSVIHPALQMLQQMDFSNIVEQMKQGFIDLDKSLEIYDEHLWAVDDELFEAIEEEQYTLETIGVYIEENIDKYHQLFVSDSYYEQYHLLLEQSIYAFKNEQYAIAAMPLFAIIDGSLTNAFKDYEVDIELKPHLRKKKSKLFTKVKDYVESTEDELAYYFIFFKRVFNVYSILFKPYWNQYPDNINRNYVMHGAYNYEDITKEDVLKLIQLVKATSILQYISFE